MKSILSLLALSIGFSAVTKADVITLDCKTEKSTSVVLVYDTNWWLTKRAELISIEIAGQEMSSKLENNRFVTKGGRPNFAITDFPQAGLTTQFNLYTTGTYTVYKPFNLSGDVHVINCEVKAPQKEKVDTDF